VQVETVRSTGEILPHWRAGLRVITLGLMLRNGRPAATDRPANQPTELVLAMVTVALVLYLIGLVLAIATNSLSGASPLLATVKSRIFSPLLVPMWLDLGYDYRLTHGLDEDADHEVELHRHGANEPILLLPGRATGERAARWRRLARSIALGSLDEDGSIVAAGVARGGFAVVGDDDLDLRVVRRSQAERDALVVDDVEEVYAARVRLVGGDVQLIRDEPPGELAPLVRTGSAVAPEVSTP